MIFAGYGIHERRIYQRMPIISVAVPNHYVLQPVSNEITTALWTYVPGEVLDFSSFSKIHSLHIAAYIPKPEDEEDEEEPDLFQMITDTIFSLQNNPVAPTTTTHPEPEPYTLPSIAALFPHLTQLFIKNWDFVNRKCFIGRLTDVPESLREIVLDDTYITDFSPILSSGRNIFSITIRDNVRPITMNLPLPDKLITLILFRTILTDSLIFPPHILRISCVHSTIPKIEGLERATNIHALNGTFSHCITPYRSQLITNLQPYKSIQAIQHITLVNAHQIYSEFASIPKRISIANIDPHVDNPIVTAMFLSSNYPRRMAEFVAVTEVNTVFEPQGYYQNPHPEDHENDEEEDNAEENAPNVDDAAYDY
jgi:hypothetical protein